MYLTLFVPPILLILNVFNDLHHDYMTSRSSSFPGSTRPTTSGQITSSRPQTSNRPQTSASTRHGSDSSVIVALNESRGVGREVGFAALDLKRYSHTLKIAV
jgi:hypothetical protein